MSVRKPEGFKDGCLENAVVTLYLEKEQEHVE